MTTNSRKSIDADILKQAAERLKVLAHPVRLRIIETLVQGEKTVSEIQDAIGEQQSVTSQHLSLLRNKGILTTRREGTHVYYCINDQSTVKILGCISNCKA